MELCGALCLLWAVLGVLAAQEESTKYLEVGKKLTLETISAIPKPITSIRWKHGSNLVVDWTSPDILTYFGLFRGRTTLDTQTLRLDIDRVTLADSGSFSLETNSGTYETYNVKVIKPPPTPSIKTQLPQCNVTCALKCTADTQDLGPVTYQWQVDEGEWANGDELKNINSSYTTEKFVCRLRTPLRNSEASPPVDNPLNKPVPETATESGAAVGPSSSPTVTEDVRRDTPLSPAGKTAIGITVVLISLIAGLIAVVYKRPDHPFSKLLKERLPCCKNPVQPANPVQLVNAVQPAKPVQPADPVQPFVPVQPSNPVQPTDAVAERESLLPQQPVTGDLATGTNSN